MTGENVEKKEKNGKKICKITASTCAFSSVESGFVIKTKKRRRKKKNLFSSQLKLPLTIRTKVKK
jgi:hypothetical protein